MLTNAKVFVILENVALKKKLQICNWLCQKRVMKKSWKKLKKVLTYKGLRDMIKNVVWIWNWIWKQQKKLSKKS